MRKKVERIKMTGENNDEVDEQKGPEAKLLSFIQLCFSCVVLEVNVPISVRITPSLGDFPARKEGKVVPSQWREI